MSCDPRKPLLVCRIGPIRIAIEAALIRDILPLLPLWRPPSLPAPLAGFISVRGDVLPVIAPGVLLGAAEEIGVVEGFSHIVRPHGASGNRPCLLVDRVEDLAQPGSFTLEPVAAEASYNGTLAAEVRLADGVAHLVSLDALLGEAERRRLEQLTEEAERRAREWAGAGGA